MLQNNVIGTYKIINAIIREKERFDYENLITTIMMDKIMRAKLKDDADQRRI